MTKRPVRSRLLSIVGYAALAAWLVFATLVIVLRYVVLPNVDRYRGDIERMASHATSETVTIGAVSASWRGLSPALGLRDVRVVDADGKTTLAVERVDAALAWRSLVTLKPRLALLEIDAPMLAMRRDTAGQLFVAGVPVRKRATNDNRAAEWLLAQDEIRVRRAKIVWHDELVEENAHSGPIEDFVLDDVAFALVRSAFGHRAALRASPPASLAAPVDVRATVQHPVFATRLSDLDSWSGTIYANVGTGDIVAWRRWFPLPPGIDAGHGRARVWLAFARADAPAGVFAHRLAERIKRPVPQQLDRVADVTADLALDDLALRWGAVADAPEYSAIGSIDGRLVASQSPTEQHVAAIRMTVQPRKGTKLAPTDFDMRRTIGRTLDDETGTASLGTIDIGATLALVPEPLIPPAFKEKLEGLRPRGLLQGVSAKWTGPIAAPLTFSGEAKFAQLAIAPQSPTPEAMAAAAREFVEANGLVKRARPAFGTPGFSGLDGTAKATRTREPGDATAVTRATIAFTSDDLRIVTPGLFDDPDLALSHFAADVAVTAADDDVELKIAQATLENPDLAATVALTYRHGPHSGGVVEKDGKPGRGWLDLDARATRADIARVPRYLPNIIGERARIYLKRALVSGKVSDATLQMRGAIERLNLRAQPDALAAPYATSVRDALVAVRDGKPATKNATVARPEGADDTVFHAVVRVHDATYQYGPGRQPDDPPPASGPPSPTAFIPWPAFEDVDADIVFDHAKMTVNARTARVYGYKLRDVTAELPALADPAHVLRVTGHGDGPMQDLVRFVNESPISRWLRRFTERTQATGDAALALALDLPLTHPRDAELSATLDYKDNDVAINALIPPLAHVRGRMNFSDRGLEIDDLRAEVLGGPMRIDATTGKDGWIAMKAKGTIDVAGLQQEADHVAADGLSTPTATTIARAARYLSGSAPYEVALRVRSKRVTDLSDGEGAAPAPTESNQPDLVVQSDLTDLAIALPEPLAKPAGVAWPLRVELSRSASAGASAPDHEDIRVTLADRVDVRIARQRADDGSFAVARAAYHVGASGEAPANGPPDVSIDLPALDVDAWRAALKDIRPAPPAGMPPPAAPSASVEQLLPTHATLRTQTLKAGNRDFTNVSVTAERSTDGWQAELSSDQVAGHVAYVDVTGHAAARSGVAAPANGRLVARLSRLSIPKAETSAAHVEDSLDAGRQKDFPAIDVVVDRFELRGRALGRLEVVAENEESGEGRAWHLQKLGLTTPEARFTATGVWGHGDASAAEHTQLDFDLQSSDVGALMDRFGLTRTINNGSATLSGAASWNGGPSTIDFDTLSGSMTLAADKGQFLKAEPGVAKLLNILSLQGLARRLTFDFTDVFSPGFAFDTVRATAHVDHGIASTDDFTMRGVQAIVRMNGRADLAHETTDLHVRIEPQINAGAASLGIAVINPIAGLATFVAQYLFKDKISEALSFEYNVSGPWAKPDVTKVAHDGKVTPVVPKTPPTPREAAKTP